MEGEISGNARLMRALGTIANFMGLPIVFAVFLYGWYRKRDIPGIPDQLSSTRQFETGEPVLKFRYAVDRAFRPALIALILQVAVVGPLSALLVNGYFDEADRRRSQASSASSQSVSRGGGSPFVSPKVAREAAADAARRAQGAMAEFQGGKVERPAVAIRQRSLDILANLEQRHRRDRGSYTADLEALVRDYGSVAGGEGAEILALIRADAIRARKTLKGVELWVEMTPGDWKLRELR